MALSGNYPNHYQINKLSVCVHVFGAISGNPLVALLSSQIRLDLITLNWHLIKIRYHFDIVWGSSHCHGMRLT